MNAEDLSSITMEEQLEHPHLVPHDLASRDLMEVGNADHGSVVQFVADPHLPSPLPQKIQTATLASILEINSGEPSSGVSL